MTYGHSVRTLMQFERRVCHTRAHTPYGSIQLEAERIRGHIIYSNSLVVQRVLSWL